MGRRRGDEGDPGEWRPVEPEEARAHGNDPDAVRIRERADAGETPRDAGGGVGREATGEGEEVDAARREDREQAAAGAAPGGPLGPEEDRRAPATTSGVQESAMRLLGAFYDLSGGRPGEEVPLGGDGDREGRGAAQEAGIDPASVQGSVERDVAVRYLLNKGYVEKGDGAGPASYRITPSGVERIGRMRGLLAEPSPRKGGRSGMSEKMQTRLLSLLTVAIFLGLNRQAKKFVDRRIPERRGVGDDILEASLQGAARLAAVVAASVLVRRLAESRR